MPSFQSLNVAISGMRAAQTGLAVTGHNMANAEISGFSRQRSIQSTSPSRTLGYSRAGQALRVGMGADNQAIHHIRSRYFDMLYRQYNARLHFYSVKSNWGEFIVDALGETEATFRLSNMMNDLWASMNELNMNMGAIETRELFIGNAIAFIEKSNNIFNELFELQQNLDLQIRNMVDEINSIVEQIHHLNIEIRNNEFSGDNANDMRDERHRLMDRLSGLVPVTFHECWQTGRIDITTISGNFFLSQGAVNPLGLLQISGRYSFVEPVFTHASGVLPPDTPPNQYIPFFDWRRPINAENNNDNGALMALLQLRGAMPATYRGIEALWNPAQVIHRPAVGTGPGGTFWHMPPTPGGFDIDFTFADFLAGDIPAWAADFIPQRFLDADPALPPEEHPEPFTAPFALNPAFVTAWDAYLAAWDNYINDPRYTGPMPLEAASFNISFADRNTWPAVWGGTWPDGLAEGDIAWNEHPDSLAAFEGHVRRHILERENDMNQFQRLFPQSITPADWDDFNTARDLISDFVENGTPLPATPEGDLARQLMNQHNAAARTYRQAEWSKENALIPRTMMHMDQVVNAVVRLINDSLAPVGVNHMHCAEAPFDRNGNRSFTEVFVRRATGHGVQDRFNADGVHNHGLPGEFSTLYTSRNLMINPVLLLPGGYNLLAFSLCGDMEDTRVLEEMIRQWGLSDGNFTATIDGETFSIEDAYRQAILALGIEVNEASTFLGSQFHQVMQADYRRNALAGVSMDEELANMMTFQFAYQAAARLFNIVDSMVDTVVNRTGRVGL